MVQRRALLLRELEVPFDDSRLLSDLCLTRLLHGAPHVQIYVLRELGHELSLDDWARFMARFHEHKQEVQATALHVGAESPQRVPDMVSNDVSHKDLVS